MKQFSLFCATAAFALSTAATAFALPEGGIPDSDECSIDICVAPDVTIECVSEELECQNFLIGESANYCRAFRATGGGKTYLTVAWGVNSNDPGVATVTGARVSYGKTAGYEIAQNVTTNPYSSQFSNGQMWQVRDHYLRICADINAINAGATSIQYEATITDYSF